MCAYIYILLHQYKLGIQIKELNMVNMQVRNSNVCAMRYVVGEIEFEPHRKEQEASMYIFVMPEQST